MNILMKVSVKVRLMSILLIWIITFVCFGTFAILKIVDIIKITETMHNQSMQVSNAAIEARVDIIKMQRDMRESLIKNDTETLQKSIDELNTSEQRITGNLNVIKENTLVEESKNLEKQASEIFAQWNKQRQNALDSALKGDFGQASRVILTNNPIYVNQLESILIKIDANSRNNANVLIRQAESVAANQRNTLIVVISIAIIIFIFFFITITNSILRPISKLKTAMNESANTGNLSTVELDGNNEITEMTRHYNVLVNRLKDIFWIKDTQNKLGQKLSGYKSLDVLTQKAINYVSEVVNAGKGVLYTFDVSSNTLLLSSAYAFTQKEKLYEKIEVGEGIIGQAALQKKAIFLTNINKAENYISTGIADEAPLNTYTLPLIYDDELYGVLSLASFEHFDKTKLDALNECSHIIAVNLYSSIQTQKIIDLLDISENARKEANESAEKLKVSNIKLQQQQELLQQQTEELQQTNTELEEQQQLLQQQSEEMQQTNTQLEEQQQQLEEQARILNTQNKKLEETSEELKKRSTELETSNRYKSEFLANMSHELRTPLNSIILLSKLLLNKAKSKLVASDKEKIDIINSAGQELLRLINDILDLSKIEAGMMTIDVQELESGTLINEIRLMFEGIAREKGLDLVVQDTLNSRLRGDLHKISQILRNLVSNALKFTDIGSVILKIAKDENTPDGVIFTVNDTGIGIGREQQEMIFEEFHQGDGSVSRKYGGTGLGLSISKKLAELLGGKIIVKSEIGFGSQFSLEVPNLIATVSEGYNFSELLQPTKQEAAVCVNTDIQLQNTPDNIILIIDDDLSFSKYLKEIIYGMGFTAIVAINGREGLLLAKQYRPKGILLDLGLPDISGIDVLRELKSTIELRDIPVHIISVWEKNYKPQKMGAVGFKQKPVEESDIIKLISRMVNFSEKDPKHLLVIEDNPVQQEVIIDLIENSDIEVKTVDTEAKALSEILKGTYDAIVLDLGLKEGNGTNVCKFIKEQNIEIPVIVYTGRNLTIDEEKEIRAYADSIIIKTANSEERLLDEVTLFLHKVRRNKKDQFYIDTKTKENHFLNLENKTILIVDDDTRNIYALATAIEQYGANVLEANNGKVALNKLKENKVDLILMDIMMPELDGYETIKTIRKTNEIKEIPIIAITAKSLKSDKDKCIEAGANDYISKPVDYDVLVRLVKVWINKH